MEYFYNHITVLEGGGGGGGSGGHDWNMYQVNYVAKPTFS